VPIQKSFSQERIESLRDWAAKAIVPGLHQDIYSKILGHVREKQDDDGSWNMPPNQWQAVMTGVVVKVLAAMRFRRTDRWTRGSKAYGGVESALRFLKAVVGRASGPLGSGAIGEDIWDDCQALLALRAFDTQPEKDPITIRLAKRINDDWEAIYAGEQKRKNRAKWCGSAYLAAMVDVMREYESDLGRGNDYDAALKALKGAETQDNKLGWFTALNGDDEITLWNTSLSLRTLCAARDQFVDRDQVERIVEWILTQLEKDVYKDQGVQAPMFLARALHGLLAARAWVDTPMRDRVDRVLIDGNRELSAYFEGLEPAVDLKAYTAVLEYLGALQIQTPAGLLFEAKKSLETAAVYREIPELRPNGLRIVWLSDLHLGGEKDLQPGRLSVVQRVLAAINPFQRWAESWMRFKGTPLAQHRPEQNLRTMLDYIAELKPDHILVTGDLTNYARIGQFEVARNLFLELQAKLRGNVSNTLDHLRWTILPGNHDISNESMLHNARKTCLGMFFRHFGDTFNPQPTDGEHDKAFPLVKYCRGSGTEKFLRLVGLDSNVNYPVWVVGMNASGRIDAEQMARLRDDVLRAPSPARMTLLVLHHHPIVVPQLGNELQDYFLALKVSDGNALIKLCADQGVSGILHGHYHAFSRWSGLTPAQQQLAIVGSPAGTLTAAGGPEIEFLELCEAERETPSGVEEGLALYRHRRESAGWFATYTGVFLPVLSA
jgi:3',5'-cyclic AMP phosphodiesterase CpdA